MTTIRPWRDGDQEQCMSVLREASWSNVWPSFLLTIKKRWFTQITVMIAAPTYLYTYSVSVFLLTILLVIFTTLLAQILGNLYYIFVHLKDMKEVQKEYFSNPDCCFWVAEIKAEDVPPLIVGTIAIVRKRSSSDTKVAWLRRMAVLNQFRGMGIAHVLVAKAIQFSKKRNYDKITLITTEVHKAARSLYIRMGFQCRDFRPFSYVGGWIKIWTYEMEFDLSKLNESDS